MVMRIAPSIGTNAPAVTWLQSKKTTGWNGSDQVVSSAAGKVQKRLRHLGTNAVTAEIA